MKGRQAVALVAQREIRERVREKSFLVSTGVNVAIIVGVIGLSTLFGGGEKTYVVGYVDQAEFAVVDAAASAGEATDVQIEARAGGVAARSVPRSTTARSTPPSSAARSSPRTSRTTSCSRSCRPPTGRSAPRRRWSRPACRRAGRSGSSTRSR